MSGSGRGDFLRRPPKLGLRAPAMMAAAHDLQ